MLVSQNTTGPIILSNMPPMYTFPLGIAYVAGYLKGNNENVEFDFWPLEKNRFPAFVQKLISKKPLVIGFGGLYPDLYVVKELIHLLDKAGRNFPVVIGGQMVTPTPEFAVDITGADYGVIGEGEIIFSNLVKALRERQKDVSHIKGLVIRDGNQFISTGPGPFIENLAKLPPIPFELVSGYDWIHTGRFYLYHRQPQWKYNDRIVPIHTGRGCPFRCNFCYHHSKSRYKSMEQIKVDINEAVERFNPTLLDFSDDLVLANYKHTVEFISMMKGLKKPIEYYLSIRFDTLSLMDDDLLRELKNSGCRIAGPGLESGSQKVLDAIHKNITVDQIKVGLRRLKDAGIMTTTCIQVGQIDETLDDAYQSLQLMKESMDYDKHIAYAHVITTPYPGSELYEIAMEKRLIKSHLDFFNLHDPDVPLGSVTINMSAMSDADITNIRKEMADVYWEKKHDSMNKSARFVVASRLFLRSVKNKIDSKVFDPASEVRAIQCIKMGCDYFYNSVQGILDNIWRVLWK